MSEPNDDGAYEWVENPPQCNAEGEELLIGGGVWRKVAPKRPGPPPQPEWERTPGGVLAPKEPKP